jgi:hypothetical protein
MGKIYHAENPGYAEKGGKMGNILAYLFKYYNA